MQEGWIFRIIGAALPAVLCAVWLPSCSAHEAQIQRPAAQHARGANQPARPRLSSDASLLGRTFETLGACEHLNPDSLGEQAFAAYLSRHAPFADAATVRSLRAAYERGANPAVADRQTPESCARAMRGLAQEAPGLHGRPDGRPDDRRLASPRG